MHHEDHAPESPCNTEPMHLTADTLLLTCIARARPQAGNHPGGEQEPGQAREPGRGAANEKEMPWQLCRLTIHYRLSLPPTHTHACMHARTRSAPPCERASVWQAWLLGAQQSQKVWLPAQRSAMPLSPLTVRLPFTGWD
eukprot:366576-Chlamydomonas_euryale.AAC.2